MSHPVFDLTGRVAVVTGGSKGLGKAIARGFAEAGADVVIAARGAGELASALAEIRSGLEVRGAWFEADMTNRADVARLAEVAVAEMGRVDILVNNAGTNAPEPADEVTDANWDRILELNLTSCMALTRALAPDMKRRRWGRIIHMSSVMGLVSREGRTAYSATKSGLLGMARAAALDLGPYGITVNCLAPGYFLTDLPAKLLTDDEKRRAAEGAALGRWGSPAELVGPALLLASEAGSYITGAALVVDGGMSIRSF